MNPMYDPANTLTKFPREHKGFPLRWEVVAWHESKPGVLHLRDLTEDEAYTILIPDKKDRLIIAIGNKVRVGGRTYNGSQFWSGVDKQELWRMIDTAVVFCSAITTEITP